jgi:hypothetical protein
MANPFNFNNFKSFLSKAAATIACGSECQKQKTSEQLKQNYLNSQTNLDSAPNQLQVAQQKYITFTQGQQAYNNLNSQQLTQKAETESSNFQNNFNKEAVEIQLSIDTYSGLYINLQNVYDLFVNYKNENEELYKRLKDETSDTLTNARKTYYEDEGIDNLQFWYYYVLLTIYVIFALSFGILSFIYPSQINWKYRLAIFIILAALPFISTYLLDLLLVIINYIYGLMPKNVHLTVDAPQKNNTK